MNSTLGCLNMLHCCRVLFVNSLFTCSTINATNQSCGGNVLVGRDLCTTETYFPYKGEWRKSPKGVLLIGYEMFRRLITLKNEKGLPVEIEQIDVAYGETGFERRRFH